MRNAHRPMGRFFYLLTVAAATVYSPLVMQIRASSPSGPATTQVVEGLFGHKSGNEKKNAVLSFIQTAIVATDGIAGKDVVDAGKFQEGLGKVIDGVVQCLNASVWSKAKQA
jgi:hypothetical protein